jgi:hypothetical protein
LTTYPFVTSRVLAGSGVASNLTIALGEGIHRGR